MSNQTVVNFCSSAANNLSQKGYVELKPPQPIDVAMMKQTFGGTIPKIVAIVDATHNTDSPQTTLARVKDWFKKLMGNGGAGLLLFVYNQPSATLVNQILKLDSGALGHGQIVGAVYDVASGERFFSEHLGWESEVF
jgi:hypothetical protein